MEHKEHHFAIGNLSFLRLCFVVLFFMGPTFTGYAQSRSIPTVDSIVFAEINKLFFTNTGIEFLNESDRLPQHFLFSIRFELDSGGVIAGIKNSLNMHPVFNQTIDSIRYKIDKELFVPTTYRNTYVIVPVFIFTVEMGQRIRYDFTLKGMGEMWQYSDSEQLSQAVIFPPIRKATAKGLVTLAIDEEDIDNTPKKLKRGLPRELPKKQLNPSSPAPRKQP